LTIAQRLLSVRERIAEAAVRSGRPEESVRLVGVSKGSTAAAVEEAVNAGLRDVGENRVQEAAPKIPAVTAAVAEPPHWHLIGHLQTNKARAALGLFDTIQSVDSLHLAQTLSRLADRTIPVLLEVQFVRAPDRFGFTVAELDEAVVAVADLPRLDLTGLMTVAPLGLSPEETRRVFRTLRDARDRLRDSHRDLGLDELSMGMTEDYEIAIEEGATVVRIGRAIFAP
jgi:hypothetical protein